MRPPPTAIGLRPRFSNPARAQSDEWESAHGHGRRADKSAEKCPKALFQIDIPQGKPPIDHARHHRFPD